MRTLTLVPRISCVLRSGPSLPRVPSPPHPQPTIRARGRQYFCEEPSNIWGSAGHIRSLSRIFLWVCFFFPFILQHLKNLTITLSSQDAQEQVTSCPCSTLLLFVLLWAPFVSSSARLFQVLRFSSPPATGPLHCSSHSTLWGAVFSPWTSLTLSFI